MSLLIRHRALPVRDLFTELSRYEFFAAFDENRDFRSDWIAVTESLTELGESERGIIKSVGMALGASDVQGQLSMLEVNAQLLDKYSQEAHEEYRVKGKLYRSIGVLAGLFIAILII
jgi:stage III sporulation protein AB